MIFNRPEYWISSKPKEMHNFLLGGSSYQAELGMTWEDWFNSGYCPFKDQFLITADIDGNIKIGSDYLFIMKREEYQKFDQIIDYDTYRPTRVSPISSYEDMGMIRIIGDICESSLSSISGRMLDTIIINEFDGSKYYPDPYTISNEDTALIESMSMVGEIIHASGNHKEPEAITTLNTPRMSVDLLAHLLFNPDLPIYNPDFEKSAGHDIFIINCCMSMDSLAEFPHCRFTIYAPFLLYDKYIKEDSILVIYYNSYTGYFMQADIESVDFENCFITISYKI